MKKNINILKELIKGTIFVVVFLFASAYLTQIWYNYIMPELFGFLEIDYWHAFYINLAVLLVVLTKIGIRLIEKKL